MNVNEIIRGLKRRYFFENEEIKKTFKKVTGKDNLEDGLVEIIGYANNSDTSLSISISDICSILGDYDEASDKFLLKYLCAEFSAYKGVKFKELDSVGERFRCRENLGYDLEGVPLPPNYIEVSIEHVVAEWIAPHPIILDTIHDYINVLINFSRYLDSFNFADGKYSTRFCSFNTVEEFNEASIAFLDLFIGANKAELIDSNTIKQMEPIGADVVDSDFLLLEG